MPLFVASSLALVAASCAAMLARRSALVAPVVDARQGEVFGALYRVGELGAVEPLIADGAYAPPELARLLGERDGAEIVLTGSGGTKISALLPELAVVPTAKLRAGFAILHAAERLRAGDADPVETLTPRYLRASDAERQSKGTIAH